MNWNPSCLVFLKRMKKIFAKTNQFITYSRENRDTIAHLMNIFCMICIKFSIACNGLYQRSDQILLSFHIESLTLINRHNMNENEITFNRTDILYI